MVGGKTKEHPAPEQKQPRKKRKKAGHSTYRSIMDMAKVKHEGQLKIIKSIELGHDSGVRVIVLSSEQKR
jgi:hypothetical protein